MASSTSVALSQALAVRDDAALETCLTVQDDGIIASSVAKLGAAQSTALLEALVARLHRQPQQAARLVPWLRALLLAHGAALAATPSGQAALQLAHQTLQERTASYNALLALSGRLQVLQAAASSGVGSGAGGSQAAPKVVFTHAG
ncbi:hypothetical protein ABPG75_000048 [Micractinium tetrahymenae]